MNSSSEILLEVGLADDRAQTALRQRNRDYVAIGHAARRLREAKGLSIQNLADDIGCSTSTVFLLEQGLASWSTFVSKWHAAMSK